VNIHRLFPERTLLSPLKIITSRKCRTNVTINITFLFILQEKKKGFNKKIGIAWGKSEKGKKKKMGHFGEWSYGSTLPEGNPIESLLS
jgi:hypothetical protein